VFRETQRGSKSGGGVSMRKTGSGGASHSQIWGRGRTPSRAGAVKQKIELSGGPRPWKGKKRILGGRA